MNAMYVSVQSMNMMGLTLEIAPAIHSIKGAIMDSCQYQCDSLSWASLGADLMFTGFCLVGLIIAGGTCLLISLLRDKHQWDNWGRDR